MLQWLLLMQLLLNSPRVKGESLSSMHTSAEATSSSSPSPSSTTHITMATLSTGTRPVMMTSVPTNHTTKPTKPVDNTTTMPMSGFETWWSAPLHRYLVYGGAGGLGLILLFILLCIIAVVRGCRRRKALQREEQRNDGHTIRLFEIQPAEQSIDEDQLMLEKVIPVSEFTSYVNQLRRNANSGFEEEFDTLAKISVRNRPAYNASRQTENELKNRFDNVYPYDPSRVTLTKLDDEPGTDYINASYIDGHDRGSAYIAAQGPLPGTVADFWRMIWELKLTTLIMLTETVEAGRDKCEKYWPSVPNEPWEMDSNLVITLSEQIPFAEYKVKIMKVENKMDPESCVPLIVTHYHFSAWPDHGVPADKTSLIHFIQRVRRHHPYFNSPVLLVHCSAGVGRTGTFITLDSMIQKMKSEDQLDIFAFVRRMRNNRPLMVQTEEQYVFIHEALEEFITCGDTSTGVANLRILITKLNKPLSDKGGDTNHFDRQFEVLEKVCCKVNSINCTEGKKPYNIKKNRYPEKVPYNVSRVALKPSAVKGSDYINASYIDGYKQQKAFIATQVPLRSTVIEFWKMIWENQCRAIVMLCNLDNEEEEDMHLYWPREEHGVIVHGKLKVTLLSEEPQENYVIRKLELREDTPYHIPGVIDYLVVTQIQHNDWTFEDVPETKSVLQIIDTLLKIQRSTGNQTITVCCDDGMGRTGTFITIFSQLERIKTESICDVFQCVKAMRLQRPFMVEDVEQLIFCYQTLADYLDTFERYANFK